MRATFPPVLAAMLLLTGCTASREWQRGRSEDGAKVWRADSGGWTAEVEPTRGRLTFLGPTGGRNFLLRPEPDGLGFGGHRVWLGPQTEWPVFWPPPANWENKAAARTRQTRDGTLIVDGADGGPQSPAIRREYRWISDGALECTVSWKETTTKGRQAIQILKIDPKAEVFAERAPTKSAPLGFIQLPIAGRPATHTHFAPSDHVKIQGRSVRFRRAQAEEKFGVPSQSLIARWADAEIHLHPRGQFGRAVGEPDGPFSSHIYLGAHDLEVVEIEQLSSRLVPERPGGRVGHSMLVELRRR
ncbi:MAG: hypothetical protein SFU53_00580 [Terrimicrobiaceae bacterium]|nr:hypothetical protein [Terrimicrobiaceae bacterium]